MCVYLCLAPCALLDEAARQGGSHRVTLEKAANSVTKAEGNQLLEKQQNRHNVSVESNKTHLQTER